MLEEPFAAAEVRRLEELHLAATELALEDDLDAGRHAEAIGRPARAGLDGTAARALARC